MIFTFSLLTFNPNIVQAVVSQTEKNALVALFNATNGNQWISHSNWLINDPCDNSWYGVSCSNNTVTSLNLSHNNLVGNIAIELGDLSSLDSLNLDFNQLSGTIPPQLGSLPLSNLSLQSNKLNGSIPVEIGNLAFTIILLNYNALSENLTQLILNDWKRTQTMAPENIRIVAASSTSISLNWDTIDFIIGAGGYRIWMSETINGNYTLVHETTSKTISAYTQSGLSQGRDYFFKLQSFSNPSSNNLNFVISDFSELTLGTTSLTTNNSDLKISAVELNPNRTPTTNNPDNEIFRQMVIVIGDNISYQISLQNSGPDSASGAGFIHNLPFGLNNGTWTCSAIDGATCPTSPQNTGNINLNVDIPVGSTLNFTISATIGNQIVENCCLSPGTIVDPNDIIPSSLLITSTITPPNGVDDEDFSSNIASQNIVEAIAKTGLWYNPNRNGHGINLERSGSNLIAVWYTYLEDGSPTWYLASKQYDESGHWNAPLLQYTWDNTTRSANAVEVGTLWLNFTTNTNAILSWDLNDQTGSEPFQLLAGGSASPSIDYSGLWYPPSDSGWGLTEVTGNNLEISVLYFYDENDQAVWALGSKAENAGSTIPLDIYSGFCPNCATIATTKQSLGTITTSFSNQTNGSLTTNLNREVIMPSWMRNINWQVDSIPIKILSTPANSK